MLNPKQSEFLALASRAAVAAERRYGVPAELTCAQAVLESGWGRRSPGNNCFGLKATARNPQVVMVPTEEVLTPMQVAAWEAKHTPKRARVIERLPDGHVRVELLDAFASFPALADCFAEHGRLLSEGHPYREALADFHIKDNLAAYIERVALSYATDPNYAKSIFALLIMRQVTEALAAARAEILAVT